MKNKEYFLLVNLQQHQRVIIEKPEYFLLKHMNVGEKKTIEFTIIENISSVLLILNQLF